MNLPGADRHPRADAISPMGYRRAAVRLLLAVMALAISLPLHLAWRLFTHHTPLARLFLQAIGRIAGARVRTAGTALHRDVFYVANHVSWIDIPALAGATGTAFVAKAEVAETPLLGWLCRLNHTVFVKREARLDVAGQINALRDALEDNRAVTIFPEGTTTDGRSLLPFKSAMLQVLEPPPPGVMVQPVLLDYGALAPVIGWVGNESGVANALKVAARKGSFPLVVHFLEPFSPEVFRGRKAIAAEAQRRIAMALEASLGHPAAPFPQDVADPARAARGKEAHDRAEG